jgi:dTDP-4-dehydrorhamnose reductase
MAQRIFIAGEHGQVAQALRRAYKLRSDNVVMGGRSNISVTNASDLISAVMAFNPGVVINTAGYTAVDKAEDDKEAAFAVNRDGAGFVAAAAKAAGAPVIHLSTDYVFDGRKQAPYRETDPTNPINVYGESKLAGEIAVASSTSNYVILRTSWVCSPIGHNFVKTMLRLAHDHDEIAVVDDQWGCPTFAADLAAVIISIGDKLVSADDSSRPCGIYHASSAGETTWYRFACEIMAQSAAKGGPACRVRAIASSEYPTRAKRPAYSCLDCSKLKRDFSIGPFRWQTSLEACLDLLIDKTAMISFDSRSCRKA